MSDCYFNGVGRQEQSSLVDQTLVLDQKRRAQLISPVRVKTTDKEEPSVGGVMVTTHLSLANLRMQHAIDVRKSDILLWCVKK